MSLLEGGGIFEGYRQDAKDIGCLYRHETKAWRRHSNGYAD
jgi:hypothetical protein